MNSCCASFCSDKLRCKVFGDIFEPSFRGQKISPKTSPESSCSSVGLSDWDQVDHLPSVLSTFGSTQSTPASNSTLRSSHQNFVVEVSHLALVCLVGKIAGPFPSSLSSGNTMATSYALPVQSRNSTHLRGELMIVA